MHFPANFRKEKGTVSDPGWLLTGEGNPEREKPKVAEDQIPRPEETGLDHPLGEEAEKEILMSP